MKTATSGRLITPTETERLPVPPEFVEALGELGLASASALFGRSCTNMLLPSARTMTLFIGRR